jgi:hypothetical protein
MLPPLISFTILHGEDAKSPKPFVIAQTFAYRRTVAHHVRFQREAEGSLWRVSLIPPGEFSKLRARSKAIPVRAPSVPPSG